MKENCIPLTYTSAAVWFQWRGTPGCPPDTKLCHTRAFCSLQTSLHPTWASRDRPPSLPLYLQPYMIIPHYYPSSARVSRHTKLRSDTFPPVINAPIYCPTLLPAACVELLLPRRWWTPVQVNWKLLSEVSETQLRADQQRATPKGLTHSRDSWRNSDKQYLHMYFLSHRPMHTY